MSSSSFAFNFLGDSSENSNNDIEKNQQQQKHIISNNLPGIEEEEEGGGRGEEQHPILKKQSQSYKKSVSSSSSSFSWIDNTSIISNYLDCIKSSNSDDPEEERPPTYLAQRPYDYDIIPISSDISLKAVKQQTRRLLRRRQRKEEGGDKEEEEDYLTSYDYNNSKSDLIPGIYEGGLKVWECSIDLCRYIIATTATEINNLDYNSHVLELGCGHGLPGCLILLLLMKQQQQQQQQQQAKQQTKTATSSCGGGGGGVVVFSDYNEYVLKDVTSINIALNLLLTASADTATNTNSITTSTSSSSSISVDIDKQEIVNWIVNHTILGAGDWNEMSKNLIVEESGTENTEKNEEYHTLLPKDGQFDYIFAAETTYTESTASETANIIVKHLKVGTGIAFVATKRYYFGVGGGSDALRERINAINNNNNNIHDTNNRSHQKSSDDDNNVATTTTTKSCYYYNVETVQVYDDGSSNIREILKITSSLS